MKKFNASNRIKSYAGYIVLCWSTSLMMKNMGILIGTIWLVVFTALLEFAYQISKKDDDE